MVEKEDMVDKINARHLVVCQRAVLLALALEDWDSAWWAMDVYRRYRVRRVSTREDGRSDG